MSNGETRDASTHTNFRIPNATHERVKAHQRDSETLGATIDRALDALEREAEYPEAVREAVKDGE